MGSLLLSEGTGGDGPSDARSGAVRLIAINPTLRAEAERLLPALEAAKLPATDEEVLAIIMREMPAWGVPLQRAEEWGIKFVSYVEALSAFPAFAVEDAVVRWNRGEPAGLSMKDRGFVPRPAQLAALAVETRRELFMAAYRARKALEYVEEQPKKVSEEERRDVAAKFATLAAELGAKPNPLADPPRPRLSPQEVAAQLRAKAAPGDVL